MMKSTDIEAQCLLSTTYHNLHFLYFTKMDIGIDMREIMYNLGMTQ